MIIKNVKIFIYLIIFHLLITTTSNALVVFPVTFLGYKLTWAAFVFPLVVVATDLTVRLLGKKIAQKTITYTYPLAIILSILVVFIEKDSLNIAFRVGFASATSYALGIIIDIFAFQQIRNNYKAWWIAPSLSTLISNFIDITPEKINHYIPGKNIKILKYNKNILKKYDFAFLGAWNFKNEIFNKEIKFLKRGGKFIIHVPYPKIIK